MAMIAKAPRSRPLTLILGASWLAPLALLAACAPPADEQAKGPAGDQPRQPAALPNGSQSESLIPAQFKALGTEPFWAITATGSGTNWTLRYSTPENTEGTIIAVEDEAVQPRLRRISGTLDDRPITIELVVGQCSDGMSDREYPYTVQVELPDRTVEGCARPWEG